HEDISSLCFFVTDDGVAVCRRDTVGALAALTAHVFRGRLVAQQRAAFYVRHHELFTRLGAALLPLLVAMRDQNKTAMLLYSTPMPPPPPEAADTSPPPPPPPPPLPADGPTPPWPKRHRSGAPPAGAAAAEGAGEERRRSPEE